MNKYSKYLKERFEAVKGTQYITIVNSQYTLRKDSPQEHYYNGQDIDTHKKQRNILKNEIIIEFDNKRKNENHKTEAQKHITILKNKLKEAGHAFIITDHKGKSPHIRITIQGLQYHPDRIITEYKRKFIQKWMKNINFSSKNIQPDMGLINHKKFIALEGGKHEKYGTIVEIIEENNVPPKTVNIKNIELINKLFKEQDKNNIEQITPEDINEEYVKEWFNKYYKESQRNNMTLAFAGQCRLSGINEETTKKLFEKYQPKTDSETLQTRQSQISYTWMIEKNSIAVKHYIHESIEDIIKSNECYIDLIKCFKTFSQSYIRGDELENLNIPPIQWHVEGLVPKKGITIIGGDSGTGKSLFSMGMAAHLTNGETFMRKSVESTTILYVDEENRDITMKERSKNIFMNAGDNTKIYYMISQGIILDNGSEDMIALENAIQELKPGVVILDSFVRFFRGEENSSDSVKTVFQILNQLIIKYDCSFIIIHHTVKTKINGQLNRSSLRGSGDLAAMADSIIMINKKGNIVYVDQDKNRHEEEAKKFCMKLEKETDGTLSFKFNGYVDADQSVGKTASKAIIEWIIREQLTTFRNKDMMDSLISKTVKKGALNDGLGLLVDDGRVVKEGSGKTTVYKPVEGIEFIEGK